MIKNAARICALLLVAAVMQMMTTGPARADSCSWSGPAHNRVEWCTGLHAEYLGSKVYRAESYYSPGYQALSGSLNVSGMVRDKEADGNCAWVRTVQRAPYGNQVHNTPKVCGAGNEKPFNLSVNPETLAEGVTVTFYLCQDGGLGCAASFFSRSF